MSEEIVINSIPKRWQLLSKLNRNTDELQSIVIDLESIVSIEQSVGQKGTWVKYRENNISLRSARVYESWSYLQDILNKYNSRVTL